MKQKLLFLFSIPTLVWTVSKEVVDFPFFGLTYERYKIHAESKIKKTFLHSFFRVLQKICIVFIFFIINTEIFSQSQPSKLPTIYIPSIAGDIDKDFLTKIQSSINIHMLNQGKNQYNIIDEEMGRHLKKQLEETQKMGIKEEESIKKISEILSPDSILSGSVMKVKGEENKIEVTLKLYKFNKETSNSKIENEVSKAFPIPLMDYYIEEIVKKTLNRNHSIDDLKAPPILNSVDFKVLELSKGEIQSLTFKTSDDKVKTILDSLLPYEKKAKTSIEAKKYKQAADEYEKILEIFDTKINPDVREKLKDYRELLDNNLQVAYTYYFQEQILDVDSKYKKESNQSNDTLLQYKNTYSSILLEFKERRVANNSIEKSINDRIIKLDLGILKIKETKYDDLYNQYKFSEAHDGYKEISSELSQKTSKEYDTFKKQIQKKMKIAHETGTYNLLNKVRSYCDYAEKVNLQASLKKDLDADDKEANKLLQESKDALENAKLAIESDSAFSNPNITQYYNSTYATINNRSEKKGENIIGEKIKNQDEMQMEKGRTAKKFDYLLPGAGLIYYGDSNGYYFAGAFLASLALSYSSYQNYNSIKTEYSQTDTFWALLAISNPNQSYLMMSLSNAQLEPIRTKAESEIDSLNIFTFLAAGIYTFNLILSKPYDTIGDTQTGLNLRLKNEFNSSSKIEQGKIYSLSYTLHFNF